jgi:hypothetical protein
VHKQRDTLFIDSFNGFWASIILDVKKEIALSQIFDFQLFTISMGLYCCLLPPALKLNGASPMLLPKAVKAGNKIYWEAVVF